MFVYDKRLGKPKKIDIKLNIVNIEKIKSICSTWIFLNLMYNSI